jgi:hypothetical protein
MRAELVEKFVSVFKNDGKYYHLNPDLIPDPDSIVLCGTCNLDPLGYPYSLANGHDYGRRKHFPELNGITQSVVTPVRIYNVDIMLKANHATGNSICFPSDGHVKTATQLPSLDPERLPQVTFLGPEERWRIQKRQWRHLYEINVPEAFQALRIWEGLKNPFFKDISIVDNPDTFAGLNKLSTMVQEQVVYGNDQSVLGISNAVDIDDNDGKMEECADEMMGEKGELPKNTTLVGSLVHSAVLPVPSLATMGGANSGIQALLQILNPKKDDGQMSDEALAEIVAQDKRRAGGEPRGGDMSEDDEEAEEEEHDDDCGCDGSLADESESDEEEDPYADEDKIFQPFDHDDSSGTDESWNSEAFHNAEDESDEEDDDED